MVNFSSEHLGSILSIDVEDQTAFLFGSQKGLEILDVSQPEAPVSVGRFNTENQAHLVRVEDGVAFLMTNRSIQIVDVKNPSGPKLLSRILDSELVEAWDTIRDFEVHNRQLYVTAIVSNQDAEEKSASTHRISLRVFDLSDPLNPNRILDYAEDLSSENVGSMESIVQVQSDGQSLYVANSESLIRFAIAPKPVSQALNWNPPRVLDETVGSVPLNVVASSGFPVRFQVISGPGQIHDGRLVKNGSGTIIVRGDAPGGTYFKESHRYWRIPAVSLPSGGWEPQRLTWGGSLNQADLPFNQPLELEIEASSGLPVDLRIESGPARLIGLQITATNLGPITVVADQPGNERIEGKTIRRRFNEGALQMVPFGQYGVRGGSIFYASMEADRVYLGVDPTDKGERYLDLLSLNAEGRLRLDHRHNLGPVETMAVAGGHAYLGTSEGLRIVDLEHREGPMVLTDFLMPHEVSRIEVEDRFVFAFGKRSVSVVDVTVPGEPIRFTTYDRNDALLETQVSDRLVYFKFTHLGENQLGVLDLFHPDGPTIVGAFSGDNVFDSFWVTESVAYLIGQHGRVQAVDFQSPSSPQWLGEFDLDASPSQLRVDGHLIFWQSGELFHVAKRSRYDFTVPLFRRESGAALNQFERIDESTLFFYGPDLVQVRLLIPETPLKRLPQQIAWDPPRAVHVDDSPIPLNAIIDRGLPVTYTVVSGAARVEGESLVPLGSGTVRVRCTAPENQQFSPATLTRAIRFIGGTTQSLSWVSPNPNSCLLLNRPYRLEAKADSGLPITYEVKSGPAVIDDGGFVTVTDIGTVVLSARQLGDFGIQPESIDRAFNSSTSQLERVGRFSPGTEFVRIEVQESLGLFLTEQGVLNLVEITDPSDPVLVGRYITGAGIQDFRVEGDLVFLVAEGAGFEVVNIQNPTVPLRIARRDANGDTLSVGGGFAYIYRSMPWRQPSGQPMQVFDITLPDDPKFLAFTAAPSGRGGMGTLKIIGHEGFSAGGGVTRYDLSDPADSSRRWAIVSQQDLVIRPPTVDSFHGRVDLPEWIDVEVEGNLLFVANGSRGLDVLDASDPADVKHISNAGLPGYSDSRSAYNAVELADHFAYYRSWNTVYSVDVGNPSKPLVNAWFRAESRVHDFRALGSSLYIATKEQGVEILQTVPGKLAQTLARGLPSRVGLDESPLPLLAVANSRLPLSYEVLSGPARIAGERIVFTGPGTVRLRIVQSGDRQFEPAVWTQNMEVRVRRPQSLRFSGPDPNSILLFDRPYPLSATTSSGLPVTFSVVSGPATIEGATLTVTGLGKVTVLARQPGDVHFLPVEATLELNPGSGFHYEPIFTGPHTLRTSEMQLVGDIAYLGRRNLQIVELSDPANPLVVSTIETNRFASGLEVVEGLAFGVNETLFSVYDVRDPSNPTPTQFYENGDATYVNLQIDGERAYLLDGKREGIEILDVSRPSEIEVMGWYAFEDWPERADSQQVRSRARAFEVVDEMAYVAGPLGLEVIDVSDPTRSHKVGEYSSEAGINDIQVVGGLAYLTGGRYLKVLDVSNPERPTVLDSFRGFGSSIDGDRVFRRLHIVGDRAYVSFLTKGFIGAPDQRVNGGFFVVNIRDPSQLSQLLNVDVWLYGIEQEINIGVRDGVVYLGFECKGLRSYLVDNRQLQTLDGVLPDTLYFPSRPIRLPQPDQSALRVDYSVISGPARIENGQLIPTGTGRIELRSEQSGNEQFAPFVRVQGYRVTDRPAPNISITRGPNGDPAIVVPTAEGWLYTIERRNRLDQLWEVVDSHSGDGEPWTFRPSTVAAEGFFRLVVRTD